jgi:hypothetical protein
MGGPSAIGCRRYLLCVQVFGVLASLTVVSSKSEVIQLLL